MKKGIFLSLVLASSLFANEVDMEFDSLNISGEKVKNDEKPFVTAGGVSTRDEIGGGTQSVDSVVRTVPGAYTQIDQTQGGVSVNIRGMTGFGRVNTKIDGVTQTNYGTSPAMSAEHGTFGSSGFSAPIDKNFLVGVDFERGTFNGSSGANSLMGSANFRTIGVDDVIQDGNKFGSLIRYSYGTNDIGPSAMISFAAKDVLENLNSVGILFAYSGQNTGQNFKTGSGKRVEENIVYPDYGEGDGPDYENPLPPSIDPKNLDSKPRSKLGKIEYKTSTTNTVLNVRTYRNDLSNRKMANDSIQINHSYSPNSDYVDINTLLAYQEGRENFGKKAVGGSVSMANFTSNNKSTTIDVSNTMRFYDENLLLTYGLNLFKNRYSWDMPKENFPWDGMMAVFASKYPDGKQKINSLYLDTTFNYDIFSLYNNINFTKSKISGHKGGPFNGECLPGLEHMCQPKGAGHIDKTYKAWNYSLMIEAQLTPNFSPFISYARTNRIPNVQEYFFTADSMAALTDGFWDINTELKQEKADTYQIGFNYFKEGFFDNHDVFGFKALFYKSFVKNYIYDKRIYITDYFYTGMYFNDKKRAKFKGVEVELKYDNNLFYTNLSYAYQKSKYKNGDSVTLEQGAPSAGTTQFAQLPEHYATLNLGSRLLDEKLDLGFIAKYTSKAKRMEPNRAGKYTNVDNDWEDLDSQGLKSEEIPKMPIIVDLYAGYKFSKNFNIKFECQNLFNKDYMDALYTYNSSAEASNANGGFEEPENIFNNSARGRTFIMSFQYKF